MSIYLLTLVGYGINDSASTGNGHGDGRGFGGGSDYLCIVRGEWRLSY